MGEFSERMKRARQERGWSQDDLAMRSGVSQQAISLIESNKRSPTEATMALLAEALGLQLSDLMGDRQRSELPLSPHEWQIIRAYRARPEMRAAVCAILGVDQEAAQNVG